MGIVSYSRAPRNVLGCRLEIFTRVYKICTKYTYYNRDDSQLLFFIISIKNLPLGTAYAIWTGIGIVGTVILGIMLFKEPIDPVRLIFIGFIVIGIIGLKIISAV